MTLTALTARTGRSIPALAFIPNPRRHDIRAALPAALQPMLQNGFLEQTFKNALFPSLLFAAAADNEPWVDNLGATRTSTRKGLLTPVTTPAGTANLRTRARNPGWYRRRFGPRARAKPGTPMVTAEMRVSCTGDRG